MLTRPRLDELHADVLGNIADKLDFTGYMGLRLSNRVLRTQAKRSDLLLRQLQKALPLRPTLRQVDAELELRKYMNVAQTMVQGSLKPRPTGIADRALHMACVGQRILTVFAPGNKPVLTEWIPRAQTLSFRELAAVEAPPSNLRPMMWSLGCLSSRGAYVATSESRNIRLWHTPYSQSTPDAGWPGILLKNRQSQRMPVYNDLSFSHDETKLAAVSSGIGIIWRTHDGMPLYHFSTAAWPRAVAFSRDDTQLCVTTGAEHIQIYGITRRGIVQRPARRMLAPTEHAIYGSRNDEIYAAVPGALVHTLACSPDGRYMAAATSVGLYVTVFANQTERFIPHKCHWHQALAFSEDGTQLVIGGDAHQRASVYDFLEDEAA